MHGVSTTLYSRGREIAAHPDRARGVIGVEAFRDIDTADAERPGEMLHERAEERRAGDRGRAVDDGAQELLGPAFSGTLVTHILTTENEHHSRRRRSSRARWPLAPKNFSKNASLFGIPATGMGAFLSPISIVTAGAFVTAGQGHQDRSGLRS